MLRFPGFWRLFDRRLIHGARATVTTVTPARTGCSSNWNDQNGMTFLSPFFFFLLLERSASLAGVLSAVAAAGDEEDDPPD
jgi:hypothetical protein